MCLVLVGVMQVLGVIGKKVDESEENTSYFDKKKERKERKIKKKVEAEAVKDADKAERLATKEIAKAAGMAKKKALKLQEAAAKKAEEEKKIAEAPKEEKKPKKKKKKKKDKSAVETQAVPDTQVDLETQADSEGWVDIPNKREAHAAKKALNGNSGPRITIEMLIHPRHFGTITGPSRSLLTKFMDDFDVEVTIPRKGSSEEKIKLFGCETKIDIVKNCINELIEKGYSKSLYSNLSDVSIRINSFSRLIGPSGAYIRAIQTGTNTRINLPGKDSSDDTVTIVGDNRDVQQAIAAIDQLMDDGYSELTHPGWIKAELPFPSSMLGVLKGTGGKTIKKIQEETNTRIVVPDARDHDAGGILSVQLMGLPDGIQAAMQTITAMQTDYMVREIPFPTKLIYVLKGSKGSTIKALQSDYSCHIDVKDHVWDPSLNVIVISGYSKELASVEQELNDMVQRHSQWRIDFPAERMGVLFGKGGAGIRQLQLDTSTRINVTEHEWDDLVKDVVVMGPIDGVQQASAAIESMAKRPERQPREPRQQQQQPQPQQPAPEQPVDTQPAAE